MILPFPALVKLERYNLKEENRRKFCLVEPTCDLYRDFEIKDVINIIFRMDPVQKKRKGQSLLGIMNTTLIPLMWKWPRVYVKDNN